MDPIVFLHGFLGSPKDWEPILSDLQLPAYCPSLPGHNYTPFSKDFTIDLPKFHLVGYSMGGRIALQMPKEKILSLTLLSTHPGLQTKEEKKQRWEKDLALAKLLFKLPIDEFLNQWYDQALFKPFKPDFAMRKAHDIPSLVQALLHYSLAWQPYFEIENVLVGERDHKFRSLFNFPILIPNAGHAIHLENPKAVANQIRKNIGL